LFKKFSRNFLRGLSVVLPTIITIYLLYWLGSFAEHLLGRILKSLLPEGLYITGMGVVAGLAGIFAVGILMNMYLMQKIYEWYESLMERVPFVKSLYSALSDLMSFFSGEKEQSFNQVVMVDIGDPDMKLMGFVTREDFSEVPEGVAEGPDTVAVYLPMSYQLGGFTVMLPRKKVKRIDMSVENALTYSLTAGVVTRRRDVKTKSKDYKKD